ncbi:MAG: stage III sporulation protein AF [Clostridia bacterium]|nr:stage III sporulation protein AF [Clostridia bacterium]
MNFVSSWAQGVIVAVIIATIIEMLLPSNSNGRYVKVVVGIFVLFSIMSPVVSKFKGGSLKIDDINLNVEKSMEASTTTSAISLDNDKAIRSMYEENLKIDIKSKVSQKGYTIGDISVEILNDNEYTLNKIQFKVLSKKLDESNSNSYQYTTTIVENIENIKVSLGGSGKDEKKEEKSVIGESEKRKLKEYLSGVYEVSESNITII